MVKCDNCKAEMEISWRVFNWCNDNSDVWFEIYIEAENYYRKMLVEEPFLDWRLYEHTYCPKCDYDQEDCLDSQVFEDCEGTISGQVATQYKDYLRGVKNVSV